MEPFVGLPVRFHVKSGEYRPAIITKIFDDKTVNLQVTPDFEDAVLLGSTRQLAPMLGVSAGEMAGCWSPYPLEQLDAMVRR